MKTITSIFLFLFTTIAFCQLDYISGIDNPGGMVVIDNFLYFTQKLNSGKVSKVDLTTSSTTVVDIVTTLNEPVGLVNNGNNLYVLERLGKLYKIDISQSNPTPVFMLDTTTGANRSIDMSIKDNFLYVSLLDDGKIVKVNITDSFPTTHSEFISGLYAPSASVFVGNELYYNHFINGSGPRLSKIDITDPNLTSTIVEARVGYLVDMKVVGDIMYLAQASQISKINLNDALPTHSSFFLDGISAFCTNMIIHNDSFYIASHTLNGTIQKFTSSALSVFDELISEEKLSTFPNPFLSEITIKSSELIIDSIHIYDLLGKEVYRKSYKTPLNEIRINLPLLSKGVYILKLNSNGVSALKKIIKN